MKKVFGVVVALLIASSGFFAGVAQAAPNDFRFTRFEADYYMSKDAEGRSTLKTVEQLTAEFPTTSRSHGIERAITKQYDGHGTSVKVASVKNEKGDALPYSTDTKNGYELLRIGDKDTYVSGTQRYVITYTQRDVTKQFDGVDEFYWDTNGTEWKQRFDEVIARVHVDDSLVGALNGDVSCYRGVAGSTQTCSTTVSLSSISIRETNLGPGENATVAIGFKSGTFTPYEPTLLERLGQLWLVVFVISLLPGLVIIVWLSVRYSRKNDRIKELGTIVPEYLPPENASVLVSELIGKGAKSGFTAVIIDLSVRHYVKLYQTQEKSLMKSAEYELEIVKDIRSLSKEEQTFIATLFGESGVKIGQRFEMKKLKSDYKVAAQLRKDAKVVEGLIQSEYEFREKSPADSRWFTKVGWIVCAIGIVFLSPILIIAALVAFGCAYQLRPLTDKGLALRRYLEGLKLYIGVAEEERLKLLQSPEGAEKSGVASTESPRQLVKLYERVLPYAVLFGQEKEWNKQLGAYYEQSGAQPDWYSGQTAFNATLFAASMNDFGTTTNSYAASSSSSSSGSSGGGSSGGGGGGGGGGGW